MANLTNVSCDYTGGGVYVYSALFNNEVWLYGGLDWYFGSYDIPGPTIDDTDQDYDAHWKNPSVPFPTWNEILDSLREYYGDDPNLYYAERQLRNANPDMNERCIILDDDSSLKDPPPAPAADRSDRLETICEFIEAFEEFLDEKGIVIPNDEKEQDPESASNIYGTDYGILSDKIEALLIRYGVLKGE